MKRGIAYWLRWLVALPGALLAGTITFLPAQIIFNKIGTQFGEDSPESPRLLVAPFFVFFVFVVAGTRIAPEHKKETAITALGVVLFIIGSVLFFLFLVGGWIMLDLFHDVFVPTVLGVAGAFTGLFFVFRQQSQKAVQHR